MKENFVNFEIAKKLKELGFDEPVLALTALDGNDKPIKEPLYEYVRSYKTIAEGWIKCPLFQQVQQWLREKHNIHIKIDDFIDDINGVEWDYEIVKIGTDLDKNGNYISLVPYSTDDITRQGLTYQEALTEAILQSLKLIEK